MSETNLGSGLLQQAQLTGALSAQDRERLRRHMERTQVLMRRLKYAALVCGVILAMSLVALAVAKMGPHKIQGGWRLLQNFGTIGALVGLDGGIFCLIALFLQRVSIRAMEMGSRLANMESLLESVVIHLERLTQKMEKPGA